MQVPAPRKTRLIPARGMPTTRAGGRRRRPSSASSPYTRVPAPPARRPVPLLPPTPPPSLPPPSPSPPGHPATRRRSAVLTRAWGRGRTRCRPGTPLPLGFAGRPHPTPAVPGAAAGAQQAGRRQGDRGQARHPEEARAAGIRPMARPGAAARRRQECPARAQVASCPPPAPGPDPGAREGGPGPGEFLKRCSWSRPPWRSPLRPLTRLFLTLGVTGTVGILATPNDPPLLPGQGLALGNSSPRRMGGRCSRWSPGDFGLGQAAG